MIALTSWYPCDILFATSLEMLVLVSVIIVAAWIAASILGRARPSLRCAIWTVALGATAASPFLALASRNVPWRLGIVGTFATSEFSTEQVAADLPLLHPTTDLPPVPNDSDPKRVSMIEGPTGHPELSDLATTHPFLLMLPIRSSYQLTSAISGPSRGDNWPLTTLAGIVWILGSVCLLLAALLTACGGWPGCGATSSRSNWRSGCAKQGH